ncbi:MAG: alkane 1-monooxygenase [Bacteroidota bacterium]
MKDLKYILAYIIPLSAVWGIQTGGWWSYAAVMIAFILLPVAEEFILPKSTSNLSEGDESVRLSNRFFDWLLYLNLPLLYWVLWIYFQQLTTGQLAIYETIGMTLSAGVIVAILGINVAHELGHRTTWYEQLMSKMMLMSALYMHFFIEHNKGHHKNIATDLDPASAKYNEVIYAFWFKSVIGGYFSAWQIENTRLRRANQSVFSWNNEMIWYHLVQAAYLVAIGLYFGWVAVLGAVVVAMIGFFLLESINYVEHYGLRRKRLASGRYEPVSPRHSWNSNHELGRIFLYELTRHSDHHYKATRKYQVLRHFEQSPQLPQGYPASILLALVPPLWFRRMNPKVKAYNNLQSSN